MKNLFHFGAGDEGSRLLFVQNKKIEGPALQILTDAGFDTKRAAEFWPFKEARKELGQEIEKGVTVDKIENTKIIEKLKGVEKISDYTWAVTAFLQIALHKLNYDPGRIDGVYATATQWEGFKLAKNKAEYVEQNGSLTQKAVLAFQRANGLKADGVAGKGTLAKIMELLGGKDLDAGAGAGAGDKGLDSGKGKGDKGLDAGKGKGADKVLDEGKATLVGRPGQESHKGITADQDLDAGAGAGAGDKGLDAGKGVGKDLEGFVEDLVKNTPEKKAEMQQLIKNTISKYKGRGKNNHPFNLSSGGIVEFEELGKVLDTKIPEFKQFNTGNGWSNDRIISYLNSLGEIWTRSDQGLDAGAGAGDRRLDAGKGKGGNNNKGLDAGTRGWR